MRFMIFVKGTKTSETGAMPSEELLAAMRKYNQELIAAGIMKDGGGLHPQPSSIPSFSSEAEGLGEDRVLA